MALASDYAKFNNPVIQASDQRALTEDKARVRNIVGGNSPWITTTWNTTLKNMYDSMTPAQQVAFDKQYGEQAKNSGNSSIYDATLATVLGGTLAGTGSALAANGVSGGAGTAGASSGVGAETAGMGGGIGGGGTGLMSGMSGGGIGGGLLNLAAAGLGYKGAKDAQGQQNALNQQYMAMGEPYRQQLSSLINDPTSYLNSAEVQQPVQQASNILGHTLSTNGNPIGSGNALTEMQRQATTDMYGRLINKENQLANFGGLSSFNAAAPQVATNAINSGANSYNALGYGLGTLGDMFNRPKQQYNYGY